MFFLLLYRILCLKYNSKEASILIYLSFGVIPFYHFRKCDRDSSYSQDNARLHYKIF